jgi:hypothetical protein
VTSNPPDQLEDEIFLAMLRLSRSGAGPQFDLITLCRELQISATPQQLLAFTSDNDGWRGLKDNTLNSIRFTMSAEGRRHALQLEEARRPRTFEDRLKAVTRSDWIALGAFIVSIIALFKD